MTIPQGDPQYLICGPAKETTAESILSALVIPYQATDLTPGSLRALRLLIEPRLGTGAQWYVFCSPSDRPTLNIATLNGRSTPQLQTFEEAGYLGMTFRVVFDFVVGFSDWRGAFLNAGA